jgi:hypothetical protein
MSGCAVIFCPDGDSAYKRERIEQEWQHGPLVPSSAASRSPPNPRDSRFELRQPGSSLASGSGNCPLLEIVGGQDRARSARAEKVLLSALRAHTNAPYKTKSLWETRRAFNRPGRARTVHRPNPAAVLQRRRRVALPHLRAIRVNCHMRWRGAAA